MIFTEPRHREYLEILTETFRASKASPVGDGLAHTMEMMLDVMVTRYVTSQSLNVFLAGSESALGWFSHDTPALNASREAPVRFGAERGAATKYSGDGTITLGERTVLYGRDNGTNVFAWQDGTALGSAASQADWTAAQAAVPFTQASTIAFGYDSGLAEPTYLRLYEFWMKLNGKMIYHFKPRLTDSGGTTMPDLSEMDNDLTITGVEDSAWWIKSAWDGASVP